MPAPYNHSVFSLSALKPPSRLTTQAVSSGTLSAVNATKQWHPIHTVYQIPPCRQHQVASSADHFTQ
eukprot:1150379-Pelagomonas_calceolata.AAC.6